MSSSLLPPTLGMPGDPEGLTFTAAVTYSKSTDVVDLLGYYFKKVVESKPDDVEGFLIDLIEVSIRGQNFGNGLRIGITVYRIM